MPTVWWEKMMKYSVLSCLGETGEKTNWRVLELKPSSVPRLEPSWRMVGVAT